MSTETASHEPSTGRDRLSVTALDYAITAGALGLWAIVLWWAWTQGISRAQYGVLFLGAVLSVYVIEEAKESVEKEDYVDLLILVACGAVMVTATVYIFTDFDAFYIRRQGWAPDHEYRLAWLVIAVILYLTWRSYGNVFLALIGGAMLYAMYGYYVPGLFGHSGLDTIHMLQMLITDLAGFYGSLTQLTAAWIAPFLLYAGLLFAFGAFDLILRLAIVSARYIESGVAQTAVLSSAIIGSINGSYAANAGMTGSFTIPTMMDAGLSGRTAAGIEGTASTSGQVLPPVMGASAFVMASMLGIPYWNIIVAGLIPAGILVASILVAVHYTSINEIGEQEMDFQDYFDEEMTRNDKLVQGVRFGVPFAVLLFTLGYLQFTVMTSALYTIVMMVALGIGMPVARSGYEVVARSDRPVYVDDVGGLWSSQWWTRGRVRPALRSVGRRGPIGPVVGVGRSIRRFRPVDTFLEELRNGVRGFRRGAVILAPIAIILAAVNGVVDLLMTTGVPSRIAIMLMQLSGGILLIAVLFGMGVCIIMGVGMPTVAAYVIVSTLVAPTFVNVFEVPELAAHFMVFYAAVMAGVTPPVAIAVVVASGIAGSNFWRSCATAITIAAPLFVLPISFIYHPEIVSPSIDPQALFTGARILFGAFAIIYGLNYAFGMRRLFAIPLRFGLFWLGVFIMIYPGWMLQLAGIAVFAVVFVGEKYVANGHALPLPSAIER
ncbi:TRAP transporter, 4TM/12TM fusion protein [Halobiforma haloterrestris]|uniref:TRAP transporter, 4TM/12TM fusion protein n=1 Tax=Natronobacterium haloterrestre TaxID=148448 RepID=A0A1I1ELU8_NATHA|nr:TRAP transporter fused permease subunit [Halobiforma haloterrestris]SFB85910.1 TRAP transporter, 4TM/12TM fusion protein [Halobiforma haloterrestris]